MENFIVRILLTIILLVICKKLQIPEKLKIVVLFGLICFLDTTDCYFYKFFKNYDCSQLSYQKTDKIVDLFTYVLVFLLFDFDQITKQLMLMFIIYRSIGVSLFVKTGDFDYLKIFFDGVNSLIAVYGLSLFFQLVSKNFGISVLVGSLVKIGFEIFHHSRKNF